MEKSRGQILIVDDDPTVCETIGDLLEARGYSVHLACTAAEGLEIARAALCDVALVDLRLPDTDGLELIKKLKENSAETEAVLITGYASLDSAIEAVKTGAFGYVTKPADPEYVLTTLEQAVKKARVSADLHRMLKEESSLNRLAAATGVLIRSPEPGEVALDAALETVGAELGEIRLVDDGTGELALVASRGLSEEFSVGADELLREDPLVREALRSGQLVIFEDLTTTLRALPPQVLAEGVASMVLVPLESEGELCGVTLLGSRSKGHFKPRSEGFLRGIGYQLGMSFDNVRLFERAERHVSQLQALAVAAERITSELKLEGALKAVMEEGSRVLGADRCTFWVRGEQDWQLQLLLHQGISERYLRDLLSNREVWMNPRVLVSGAPVVFEDARTAPELRPISKAIEREGISSVVFLPLRWQERAIGALVFYHDSRRRYSPTDLDLAMTFAHQAAIAIENARQFSERKLAEEELHRLNEELEERVEERTRELEGAREELVRKQRLAILGELAASVSRELRQPLAALRNSIYYLDMKLEGLDEKCLKHLGIIKREIKNADQIIDHLLEFAQVRAPERRAVDVNQLAREALERAEVPENVRVRLELQEGLPPVSADPEQISRVLLNLIVNAIQAMPEGGELCLKSGVGEVGIEVAVRDTGCGIRADEFSKVFEPLFTTKARGIGLGLAIVRNLIEAHGGSVAVESKEGQGSTFTITLPLEPVS